MIDTETMTKEQALQELAEARRRRDAWKRRAEEAEAKLAGQVSIVSGLIAERDRSLRQVQPYQDELDRTRLQLEVAEAGIAEGAAHQVKLEARVAELQAELRKHVACSTCGQVDRGQTGEYPCPACGLPRTWDEPVRCAPGCKGIELAPGEYSGCACPEGKLANGEPQPPGFECDCPNHPRS